MTKAQLALAILALVALAAFGVMHLRHHGPDPATHALRSSSTTWNASSSDCWWLSRGSTSVS